MSTRATNPPGRAQVFGCLGCNGRLVLALAVMVLLVALVRAFT